MGGKVLFLTTYEQINQQRLYADNETQPPPKAALPAAVSFLRLHVPSCPVRPLSADPNAPRFTVATYKPIKTRCQETFSLRR